MHNESQGCTCMSHKAIHARVMRLVRVIVHVGVESRLNVHQAVSVDNWAINSEK